MLIHFRIETYGRSRINKCYAIEARVERYITRWKGTYMCYRCNGSCIVLHVQKHCIVTRALDACDMVQLSPY